MFLDDDDEVVVLADLDESNNNSREASESDSEPDPLHVPDQALRCLRAHTQPVRAGRYAHFF